MSFTPVPALDDKGATLKTDADVARDLRAEAAPLLAEIAKLMDSARAHGMIMSFTISPDQFGRNRAGEVTIVKAL